MRKNEKTRSIFFSIHSFDPLNDLENFKISIDIKVADLLPYKNHHNKSKYPTVMSHEHFQKVQFKSGHHVQIKLLIFYLLTTQTTL